jgi:hypothetical protein
MQRACCPGCALELAKADRERKAVKAAKEDRKMTRAKLAAIKPRAKLLAEAQAAVNRYVRLRDAGRPCVSCDRPPSWDGQWHASHLRSVGAASAVRFNLWNIWRACSICNHHLSGNLAEYEPRLRALIGDAKVDWLRAQNQRVTYDRDYLLRLRAVFTKKARRIESRIA